MKKFFNNKTIFYILFLVVFVGLAVSSWYTYKAYGTYRAAQAKEKELVFVKKIANLESGLIDEVLANVPMIGGSSTDTTELGKKRNVVLGQISDFTSWIEKNRKFEEKSIYLADMGKNLGFLHSKIDTVANNYADIFFNEYGKNIFGPLTGSYENVSIPMKVFPTFVRLEKLRYRLALEEAFLEATVKSRMPMTTKALTAWDRVHTKNVFPLYDENRVHLAFSVDAFDRLGVKETAMILIRFLKKNVHWLRVY